MKKLIITLGVVCLLPLALCAESKKIGFVNFKNCLEESKEGLSEKDNFESLKSKLGESLEKSDKELMELSNKLQDQEYLETLSEVAQNELKMKFESLNQEFARYQNQYYQILQQANYRVMQNLHKAVCEAAEKIRKDKKLDLILNEESTFAYAEDLDYTKDVIKLMDEFFEKSKKEVEKK